MATKSTTPAAPAAGTSSAPKPAANTAFRSSRPRCSPISLPKMRVSWMLDAGLVSEDRLTAALDFLKEIVAGVPEKKAYVYIKFSTWSQSLADYFFGML